MIVILILLLQIGHKATVRSAVGTYLTDRRSREVITKVRGRAGTTGTKEARVEADTPKTREATTRTDITRVVKDREDTKDTGVTALVSKVTRGTDLRVVIGARAIGITRVTAASSKDTAVTKVTAVDRDKIETDKEAGGVDSEIDSKTVDEITQNTLKAEISKSDYNDDND